MRLLSSEELLLVAGGWYSDSSGWTIQPPGGDPGDYGPPGGGPGAGGSGGGSGGSGDGGASDQGAGNTYTGQPCAEQAIHQKIDAMANHDVDHREHAAIVYHDSSGYHDSPIFEGNGQQTGLGQIFDWMRANGIAFSQVVDLFHNHDSDTYGDSDLSIAVNRYPSHSMNDPDDWDAADYFVQQGADPSVFTMTIEDTEHVIRDFHYSDEDLFRDMGNDSKDNGSHLPASVAECH